MFITKHFQGRMRYETDKVACIDVYYEHSFVCQVYIALNTGKYVIPKVVLDFEGFEKLPVNGEIEQGVLDFLQMRKNLGL